MAGETPQVLGGRFRVDGLIAEGGMSRIYRGTDTVLGRTVAVKVLSESLARDPQFVARFQREARAVASLNHPNIVAIFDTGSQDDLHYLVMEFVQGDTLDAVIRRQGPMPQERVAGIGARVCDALDAAHGKGIIHRDVKPANIMVEAGGAVKVMDFGIAKTAAGEGHTQVGAVLGTVRYLSPEQAGGGAVDGRTDIYSLGCVMYEMLTGRPPLSGDNLMEIAHKLATEEPPAPSALNPAVSPKMDRVVMRALAKDPADRYPDIRSMGAALAQTLPAAVAVVAAGRAAPGGGPPTLVQRPGDRTRVMPVPDQPAPRRFGLLALALVLIAGGAYALVAQTLGGRNPVPAPPPAPQFSLSPAPPLPETPSPSPSPSPEPSPEAEDPPLNQAIRSGALRIKSLIESGFAAGDLSERAARNIFDEVEKVVSEVEDQDLEDALDAVGDARDEVEKYLGREEISQTLAAEINAELDRMAGAIAS